MEELKKTPYSPSLAASLSFLCAGLGQVYNGQIWKAVLIFLTSWLFFPWILSIVDAYKTAQRLNNGETPKGPNMKVVVGVGIALVSLTFLCVIGLVVLVIWLGARQ
jgi:hypothetical protein